jgi:hypothetical protein
LRFEPEVSTRPAGQSMQPWTPSENAPAVEYLPAAQVVHSVAEITSASLRPPSHSVHALAPTAE